MTVTETARSWTYEDLQRLPDDGRRHERIDGELYELPTPNEPHQRAQRNLIVLILPEVTSLGAEWYASSTGVFLPDGKMLEPDLLVYLPGGRAARSHRGIEGAPELVVEILSPSNPEHDLTEKRAWYAEAGVREYWLVSPEARLVEVLALEGGAYRTLVRARGDELVRSSVLPGLSFPASAAFA